MGKKMKVLLSCVNSSFSLLGFDWDRGEVFWELPSERLKVCGICYDGRALLVASDNAVTRFTPLDVNRISLSGPHEALGHSVHLINEHEFGVVDTGNSAVRVFRKNLEPSYVLNPVAHWNDVPEDAIHLNDFAVTPFGILASCFGYRPWRSVQQSLSWEEWCRGGYGLILNLSGRNNGVGAG